MKTNYKKSNFSQVHCYLLMIVMLFTSCNKNQLIEIDQDLSERYLAIENELIAFKAHSNIKKISKTDFSAIIDKLGTSNDIYIFGLDENNQVKKLLLKADFNSNEISINLSKGKYYLASKPISAEIGKRYELINKLSNIDSLNVSPEICQYILCSAENFRITDFVKKFPKAKQFEGRFNFIGDIFPPSPFSSNSVCNNCFINNPIFINPKDFPKIPVDNSITENNCNCNPNTSLSDYDILKILYEINPSNTLGWNLSDKTMHSWKGVVLINGKVRALSLREANLNVLPKEIGFLCNLISLEVYDNNIVDIPQEIENLFKLEQLSFNTNAITSVPVGIWKLTNLQEFLLNGNQITIIPEEIGNLKKLKGLNLGRNQLTVIPSNIGFLNKLKYLNLAQNNLNSVPESLKNLSNLKGLDLRRNPVTSIPIDICNLEDTDTFVNLDDGNDPAYQKDSCE